MIYTSYFALKCLGGALDNGGIHLLAGRAAMTTVVSLTPFGLPRLSQRTLGMAALALTVLVWSGFFLSLRAGARAALSPAEIAVFRFAPAALCFAPVLWRRRNALLAVPPRLLALIVTGAGLPYFLVAGMGMRHAPVADGATLLPGALPLTMALVCALLARQWPVAGKRLPLALIAAGVALMVLLSVVHPQPGLWRGYALFALGSLMWTGFTLALRQSGLSPVEGAAVVTFGSLPLLAIALVWQGGAPRLAALSLSQIGFYLVAQGVGVGLVSTLAFAYAVMRLGAERAAVAGALTPVVAAVLAMPLLHEWPPLTSLAGMALIVAGVALANRAR
jgi:drug/metabolite transporter (DMT)-like permease